MRFKWALIATPIFPWPSPPPIATWGVLNESDYILPQSKTLTPTQSYVHQRRVYHSSALYILMCACVCDLPGNLCPRHRDIFHRNPLFAGMRLPDVRQVEPLSRRFIKYSREVINIMQVTNHPPCRVCFNVDCCDSLTKAALPVFCNRKSNNFADFSNKLFWC